MTDESYLKGEGLANEFIGIFKFSGSEVVHILVLTVLLILFTTFVSYSIERVSTSSSTYPIAIEHYGFPFDSLKKINIYHPATRVWKGQIEFIGIVESTVEFEPLGFALDLLVYVSLSLVIVKAVSKLKEKIYYSRYPD